jgi:hypothetical protein
MCNFADLRSCDEVTVQLKEGMLKLVRNKSARTSDPSDMEPSRCGMNHGHMDID